MRQYIQVKRQEPGYTHPRRIVSGELLTKLDALREQGVSCRQISLHLGLGYATVYRAVNRFGAYAR